MAEVLLVTVRSEFHSPMLGWGRTVQRRYVFMISGTTSRSLVFLAPLLAALWGCDVAPADSSPSSESNLTQIKAVGPNLGAAQVEVIFNNPPQVSSMTSSDGRVASNTPVTLAVVASDADGDPLTYAWTSNCPGAFDSQHAAQVTFTPGTLAAGVTCAFSVEVSDGHGGVGKGTVSLSSALPKIDVAPTMGVVYQSTDVAAPGQVVVLNATAIDPEGEAITWNWTASNGTLSNQVDQAGASDVKWQAPATPGETWTITATATDPEGASASFKFTVKVSG